MAYAAYTARRPYPGTVRSATVSPGTMSHASIMANAVSPPPGGMSHVYLGMITDFFYIWDPDKCLYNRFKKDSRALVSAIPADRVPQKIRAIPTYGAVRWDTGERPEFIQSRNLPMAKNWADPSAIRTIARSSADGSELAYLDAPDKYPFNTAHGWGVDFVYERHRLHPEIFCRVDRLCQQSPSKEQAKGPVQIKNVDWLAVRTGLIDPPGRVVPATVNGAGDDIEYYNKARRKAGVPPYDGFSVKTDGRVYWALIEKPGSKGAACYTLDGKLAKYWRDGKWVDYTPPEETSQEAPEPDVSEIFDRGGTIIATIPDPSHKPFDPVAMCRENERLRHMFDTRTPVNIQWLRPGQKRY